MDSTTLLAQIWGPIAVAAGFGFFFSTKYYVRIYRDIEKNSFAVLFFGMVAMAAGTVHILYHNIWGTFPQALISLFGWGLLVKGVICTTFPGMADQGGDWMLSTKLVPAIGGPLLLLGLYVSWLGYFA